MPQVVQVKRNHRKRYAAIAGGMVAVLLIVVSVVGYSVWRSMSSAQDIVSQADALNAQGKYQDAYDKLQQAYGWAFTNQDKVLLTSRLASTKYDMGDFKAALKYYQHLDTLQPHNAGTLVDIGDLAVQTGDKAAAVKAYSEAIPLMQAGPKGPTTAANIQNLQQEVAELQK